MLLLQENLFKAMLKILIRFQIFGGKQHFECILELLSFFNLIAHNFAVINLIQINKSHQIDQLRPLHTYFNVVNFEINSGSLLWYLLKNKVCRQTNGL